jgi:energy-coupling factor transporter ATP-binding protein EcfA2
MIHEIEADNFQSLRELSMRLGRFTVITGPTGTGKSAFLRAVRLLAFNARGTGYVSRGQKTCRVSAAGDDGGPGDGRWQATVHRGGKDNYQLAVGVHQRTYTKLAGKVPEAVTAVMRLSDVNFAGQFDRPYLLDATGSEVARVLGRLTNVTLLYRAAQEANRRRLAAAGELRTRQADLASLQAQVAQYASLPAEKEATEAAEAALSSLRSLEQRKARLSGLLASLDQARTAYAAAASRPLPEPPSLARLEELAGLRSRLMELAGRKDEADAVLRGKTLDLEHSSRASAQAQQELDRYTEQWGVCPACGQPVRKDHTH